MLSIKETLDSLSEQDRKRLLYSFEHGLGQHVEIVDGPRRFFIGVNVEKIRHLIPEYTVGVWSIGTIKETN